MSVEEERDAFHAVLFGTVGAVALVGGLAVGWHCLEVSEPWWVPVLATIGALVGLGYLYVGARLWVRGSGR